MPPPNAATSTVCLIIFGLVLVASRNPNLLDWLDKMLGNPLVRPLKVLGARLRFYKHYLIARPRRAELQALKLFIYSRLLRAFTVNGPAINVELSLLKTWQRVCGILFDAPIVTIVFIDGTPAFGMAFEVKGKCIRIRQLQGVRGFCTRGRFHPVRLWPQFLVEACQDFATMHDYSQVRVVRGHHSYSWKRPNTYRDPDTTEDILERQLIRLRLIRRLDYTADALGFEQQKNWWIWKTKKQPKAGPAGWVTMWARPSRAPVTTVAGLAQATDRKMSHPVEGI